VNQLDLISLELARRRLHEKIRYFMPNGGQERFYSEIFRPGGFIIVNGSGNGGGKTYSLVAFLAAVIWPNLAPACFADQPLVKSWPYPKRARVISTPKEVEEIGAFQSAILELFPHGQYEAKNKSKNYPSQFKANDWVVDVMTYEQAKSEFAGPNIGLTLFNEPMPEDIWKESLIRARKGGLILCAMTSLTTEPWVVDGILNKADGGDIRVVYSDVEENCREHGKNGTLDHATVEKILSQYDPDEREARKTGKPLSLSGRILRNFDRAAHVAEKPIPETCAHYMVCDPAIGKPLALIWAWADAAGAVHIYDEDPEYQFAGAKDSNLTVPEYTALIKAKEAGRPIAVRILDRHFGNVRRTMGGKTLKQEFSDAGLDFEDSYSMSPEVEVETGIMKIKDYLRYDKSKPLDSLNQPRLTIDPKCRNTIASLERSSRDPKTGRQKDDEQKDFFDDVRMLVMSEPKWEPPTSWPQVSRPFHGAA
jgi:hypothetical protein